MLANQRDDTMLRVNQDEWMALQRKASAYDRLMKQQPVAQVWMNMSGQISIRCPQGNAWDMSKYIGQSLYVSPAPEPLTIL